MLNKAKQATILVLDADISRHRSYDVALGRSAYTLKYAVNGEQALIARLQPDLILLDAGLPADGIHDSFSIVHRIKRDPHTCEIPVILISNEARQKWRRAGVDEFLSVPVDGAELLLRVENQLKMRQYHHVLEQCHQNEQQRCPNDALQQQLKQYHEELLVKNQMLRQNQSLLTESIERYQHLYDFAPVGYLTLDGAGLIVEINPTAAALLGDEPGVMINGYISQYILNAELWDHYFGKMLQDHFIQQFEVMLRRVDGTHFYARVDGKHTDEGRVRIALTDISQHRQIKKQIEQIRQSQDNDRHLLEAILDNAPIGIWMLGIDHKIKFINKTFCNAVGVTEEQFKNARHYSEALPLNISANCMQSDRECYTQNMPHISWEWLPFVDEKHHLLEITKTVLKNDHGTLGLIGLAQDITQRRQAEMSLQESEQMNQAIFEGVIDGIFLVDIKDKKFVKANLAMCNLLGYQCNELIGRKISDIYPESEHTAMLDDFHRYLNGDIQMSKNIAIKRLDGSIFYADIKAALVEIGEQSYIVGVLRDITERRKTEADLNEQKNMLRELSVSNTAKREDELKKIAQEVHDELGQDLSVLRMDIWRTCNQIAPGDQKLLNIMEEMKGQVDRVILCARNVTTNLRPPMLELGLFAALEWMCRDFSSRTGIECVLQIVDQEKSLNELQLISMFRIVQESLTNILRHAGASKIDVNILYLGDMMKLIVSDNGHGFDFLQLPKRNSFGLMGMRERAISLGGEFEIKSDLLKGTVISVTIPVTLEA
jgi:PAS domain S-box-containing protein